MESRKDFYTLFSDLKKITNNDPSNLENIYHSDNIIESDLEIYKICSELMNKAAKLKAFEENSSDAFHSHISASDIAVRRDYDKRWANLVEHIGTAIIRIAMAQSDELKRLAPDRNVSASELIVEISTYRQSAEDSAHVLESFMDRISRKSTKSFQENGRTGRLYDLAEAWRALLNAGLDVEGALRRCRELPIVLIPSRVANHYADEGASLYRKLRDAGHAFVFGAPLAVLTMQRAVMEEVLKKHWSVESGKVHDAVALDLPAQRKADRLRNLANEALHDEPRKMEKEKLERTIIENFLLLRELIENAPASGNPRK